MIRRVTLQRAAVALFGAAAILFAAPFFARATATELTRIPASALSDPADALLEEGQRMEASRQWAAALSHYERALRDHPNHADLLQRYDLAKLHYSLGKRYADKSFRAASWNLDAAAAAALYSSVLTKIKSHYVASPPWRHLVVRGTAALDIALADASFRETHLAGRDPAVVDRFRSQVYQIVQRRQVRSQYDAEAAAQDVARHAHQRLGLAPTAVVLEYAAAAAGGLDSYSALLTADQLRDVYSQIEGNFVGLGVELKAEDGGLLIMDVISGSPAERFGVLAGDRIVNVDGRATTELTTDQAASLLAGKEGTVAQLTVITPGEEPRRLNVRREHIEVPSIEDAKIVDAERNVAYLRLPTFQKSTAQELDTALWDLHRQGMRILILDLRGNPGGLLTASVEVADMFLQSGHIVFTRGRNPSEEFNYTAKRVGTWRVPLIVLIDEDSASASEILAGAIRDHSRGVVIGERSFGKGSVQGIFPLATAGMGLRLTTAKFLSPSGREISKVGIQPHIVPRHAAKATPGATQPLEDQHDPILDAAIQRARRPLSIGPQNAAAEKAAAHRSNFQPRANQATGWRPR